MQQELQQAQEQLQQLQQQQQPQQQPFDWPDEPKMPQSQRAWPSAPNTTVRPANIRVLGKVVSPPAAASVLAIPAIDDGVMDDKDAARLFVGALPLECNDQELHALVSQVDFSHLGLTHERTQLLECRALPGRGCGYIRFSSWEAATEALAVLNGRAVTGWPQPLRVKWAVPKSGNNSGGDDSSAAGPAPLDSRAKALRSLLGPHKAKDFMRRHQVGSPASLAQHAVAPQPNLSSEESSLRAQGMDPLRLFVGQLTRDLVDPEQIRSLFESFGEVKHVRFLQDKGVAYVSFNDFASARMAMESLHHANVPGISRDLGLNIAFSKIR